MCPAETADPDTVALRVIGLSLDDYAALEDQVAFDLDRERQVFQ